MNNIVLKGRLTADPELKYTQGTGFAVCNFTVAVNRRYDKETTDFISCQAWRQTAEFICKYFGKGKEILLSGELHLDNYTTKEGEKRTFTRVSVDAVEFCGDKHLAESKPSDKEDTSPPDDYFTINEEDVPF